MDALEARRRVLLARCEQQRLDLSYRFERIRPSHQLSSLTSRAHNLTRMGLAPPVLFWGATIAATLLILRPGKTIGKVAWLTSAVALVGRATQLMRLLGQFKQLTAMFRPGPGPG